ncbi:MAG: preprotein translocase subunit SecE [Tissierellia bacterium]|nr:preprotein translocase subunit SecE [Tissierellia bacterium]
MANSSGAVKKQDKDAKSMKKYFRGVRSEFRKVVWPTKKQLLNYTGVVILVSILVALVIYGLDFIIRGLLSLIIGA